MSHAPRPVRDLPPALGMTLTEGGAEFAVYAGHATAVEVCLFEEGDLDGTTERRVPLTQRTHGIWFGFLEGVGPGQRYGLRADGPWRPSEGLRYNPAKLLLDPYTRAVEGDVVWLPPVFAHRVDRTLAGDDQISGPDDSAAFVPRSVVVDDAFDWDGDTRPNHSLSDTVLYEAHVRNLTRLHPDVPEHLRGTYAGLCHPSVIRHLKELGVTAVELMPVFQFDPQEGNYWGYMPLNFFALHHAYAAHPEPGGQLDEFRALVKALHAAGIELILDVVYNHTVEGDENGPTYSFRGVDNTTYYLLAEDRRHYRNDSGTGNVLHTANRYVAGMIMDSLHHWARQFRVDGFRFDLASLFTRRADGSIDLEEPPVISATHTHPDLARLRLIAEAWDVVSYQLGRSFPGTTWLQWNDAFRDDVRSFVRGDQGFVSALMRRLSGSDDLFPDTTEDAYHAYQSINFVTCHDGFCLYDLVSYDRKHNEANGEGNRDGRDDNRSWNCGWEGDEGVPEAVVRLRRRQAKNLFCLLMLANGTPMFMAGDEFLNSQRGNNNPYNQDNETTWLDWNLLQTNADFHRFCTAMIAFRKAHPSLGRSRSWRQDVAWYGAIGSLDLSAEAHTLAFLLRGSAEADLDLYVLINAGAAVQEFLIQDTKPRRWRRVIDTARDSPEDILSLDDATATAEQRHSVEARSVVVLVGC